MKNPWLKPLTPTYFSVNLFDIAPDFFVKKGFRYVMLDLDNTLGSYLDWHPSRRAMEYVDHLKDLGLTVCLVSNNREKRVSFFASQLGIAYIANAHKPSRKVIQAYLESNAIPLKAVVLIGDQLLTDCLVANRLGIASILTDKLVPNDHWPTRFNRLIDAPLRRYLKQRGRLLSWRTAYDRN